ncbi:MAG: lamin tail domain-containing protein [Candidatus Berkelbacteria bacterium]|nr:lamin tail domain-containing protein [Candidatus Berkelbacteria bacterium]
MGRGISKTLFGFSLAVFAATTIFLFSPKTKAADDHIVINEIYPNQISDDVDTEWAEIFDPDDSVIDLNSYTLVKITGSGTEYKKPLSPALCPKDGEYYVCDLGVNWLANSGATLVLRKNFIEIDRVAFGSLAENAPIPSQGQSISRIPNGQDTGNDAADFQIVPITRGSENILPPPVVYSSKVYINEILPQPATGSDDEFIELINSSDVDVDLLGWQLDAGTFGISTIIKSGEYRVFKNLEIKIGLTDTGDITNLIDPDGEIKSTVSYGKSFRGQSFANFLGTWQWTTTPTPGEENKLTIETSTPDQDPTISQVDIATAKKLPDDESVIVSGIVSAPPGKLSSQYFYVQDQTAGIQIYNYNKEFPVLSAGDEVQLTGVLATTAGEWRIKTFAVSDIQIIQTHPPPAPVKTTIADINNNFVGQYISIIGTVTKTSGSTFYIHGSGEIEIIIRAGTDITKPKMRVGDKVQVAGILSQYNDTFRILPIVQSDVKIVGSGKLPATGENVFFSFFTALIITIIIWNIRQKVRQRRKNWLKSY